MKTEALTACPKCKSKISGNESCCFKCGLVFEKYVKKTREMLESAISVFESGDPFGAENEFKALVSSSPEFMEQARSYLDKIEKLKASNSFNNAVDLFEKKDFKSAMIIFNSLSRNKNNEFAEKINIYIDKISEIFSIEKDRKLNLAKEQYETGCRSYSKTMFKEILEEYPDLAKDASIYLNKIDQEEKVFNCAKEKKSPMVILRCVAYLNIIGGVILGISCLFGHEVILGIVYLFGCIIGASFIFVICLIAESIIDIDSNIKQWLTKQ